MREQLADALWILGHCDDILKWQVDILAKLIINRGVTLK